MPPTLFIKNALRLADAGIINPQTKVRSVGDGTVYASGTGATPNTAQKTFALAGLSIIANAGADADDKFNGHVLRFPASGNIYHIVDWVAGTDTATVYENPASTDTGACEIRRALVCGKQLAGNPAHNLADGQRATPWKSAANTVIEVHLPNLVDNGGFEQSGASVSPWNASASGGTSDATGINATTPILGTRDLKINKNDRDYILVDQIIRPMMKNRTYRLLFKARHTGVFTANQFSVTFFDSGEDVVLSAPSSGNISGIAFRPTLSTGAAWHWVDVTAPNWDLVNAGLRFILTGVFDVYLDEVYLFEKVNVGALLLFDHSGLTSLTNLTGRYVSKDRSGQTAAVDNVQILGTSTIRGGNVGAVQFNPAVYPIYTIESSNLIEASEILLAQKWTWGRHVMMPFDPELIEKEESIFRSRSGVEESVIHHRRRRYKGRVRLLSDTDRDIWKNDWYPHHHDPRHPFAVQIDATRPIVLMNDAEDAFGLEYDSVRPSRNFNWVEVVK